MLPGVTRSKSSLQMLSALRSSPSWTSLLNCRPAHPAAAWTSPVSRRHIQPLHNPAALCHFSLSQSQSLSSALPLPRPGRLLASPSSQAPTSAQHLPASLPWLFAPFHQPGPGHQHFSRRPCRRLSTELPASLLVALQTFLYVTTTVKFETWEPRYATSLSNPYPSPYPSPTACRTRSSLSSLDLSSSQLLAALPSSFQLFFPTPPPTFQPFCLLGVLPIYCA